MVGKYLESYNNLLKTERTQCETEECKKELALQCGSLVFCTVSVLHHWEFLGLSFNHPADYS